MEAVLEPPALPVYSHVLSVDRRLQIESVSVRERDAERRLRWSEARPVGNSGVNRVTVFLTDPMTEAQQLTLVASLPISGPGALLLPNVRLENTESAKSRLEVSADPSWQLEWNSLRGLKRILKPLEETGAGEGMTPSMPSWEYEVQDPDWRGTIRLRPFDESSAIRAVYALQHASAETVDLHACVEIPPFERSARIAIEVPRPWELKALPNTGGLQVDNIADGAGGWTRLTLSPDVGGPIAVRFQAHAVWSAFPEGECTLPVVRGTGSRTVRTWLAEIAVPPLVPRLKTSADEELLNPPSWAVDWLNDLAPMTHGQRWVARIEDDLARWPLAVPEDEPESVDVRWLEHRLWRQASQPDSGVTLIRLAESTSHLTVRAPERVRISAAVVDGRHATILSAQDRDHRLSAADGQPFQEALVYWRSLDVAPAPWSGFVETSWLTLPRAEIAQQALAIFPAADEVFWPVRGWIRSDSVDRILQRLEVLSDILPGDGSRATEWAEARLRAGVELAAGQLALDDDANREPLRHERWQSMVERVRRLPEEPSASTESQPLIEELLADHPAAEYGLLDPTSDHTWSWRIDDRALRAVGAGMLFLGAMLVLRLVLRPALRDWLRAHPHGAVGLLGLVWWLCLTPSIFGLALMAWSAYRAVTVPRIVASSDAAAA